MRLPVRSAVAVAAASWLAGFVCATPCAAQTAWRPGTSRWSGCCQPAAPSPARAHRPPAWPNTSPARCSARSWSPRCPRSSRSPTSGRADRQHQQHRHHDRQLADAGQSHQRHLRRRSQGRRCRDHPRHQHARRDRLFPEPDGQARSAGRARGFDASGVGDQRRWPVEPAERRPHRGVAATRAARGCWWC